MNAILTLALALAPAFAQSEKTITRELLMKGCPIPERREFPLSTKVPACQDFHKYVCGEVESSFKLPKDRSSWTFSFSDNAEKLLYAKKNYFRLVGEGYAPGTPRAAQIKEYYLACMNAPARTLEEKSYAEKQKAEILGLKTLAEFRDFAAERMIGNETKFVDFGTAADQADSLKYDVYVLPEVMSLPEKSFYENPAIVADLTDIAELFFKELGLDEARARAEGVVELEKTLAKASLSPADMRNRFSQNTYVPRATMLKKYPNLQLNRLFAKIPAKTRVRDMAPETMAEMNRLLATAPLGQLQNALLFHTVKGAMDDAYPAFFEKNFKFQNKYFGGPEVRSPRDERCTRAAMGGFAMELDEALLPVLFPGFPRERVVELAQKVRGSLLNSLRENTWLSPGARKMAIKKMDSAALHLVQPRTESEWNFLPVRKYDRQTPIANSLALTQAQLDRQFADLKKPRDRDRWSMGPLTLNAYYSGADNKFVLLLGILQSPFFSPQASDIENIGAIGTVVGHELGHGIDDKGSKYDPQGRLRDWMTPADHAALDARTQMLVERFDRLGHNGKFTLGENIGDHVGLSSAIATAFPDQEHADLEQARKLFVAYGRAWCSVIRPEFEETLKKTDPHAMGYARINGQVVDHELFVRAFACKPGDAMYVEKDKRIRVW